VYQRLHSVTFLYILPRHRAPLDSAFFPSSVVRFFYFPLPPRVFGIGARELTLVPGQSAFCFLLPSATSLSGLLSFTCCGALPFLVRTTSYPLGHGCTDPQSFYNFSLSLPFLNPFSPLPCRSSTLLSRTLTIRRRLFSVDSPRPLYQKERLTPSFFSFLLPGRGRLFLSYVPPRFFDDFFVFFLFFLLVFFFLCVFFFSCGFFFFFRVCFFWCVVFFLVWVGSSFPRRES